MYVFNEDDAFAFARHINANVKRHGDELVFKVCPFCKAEHKSDREKFSINLKTGQFNCFRASCGMKGNMITLSKTFEFPLPGFADEYINHRKRYVRFKQGKQPEPTPPAIEYLQKRGISKEVAESYHISTKPDNNKVLLIPFYDENNVLQLIKYRDTTATKENGRTKEWAFKDGETSCKPILFGMDHCDPEESDTLVITEGQMDTLAAATAGVKNVVSVPTGANGFTWVPYCWDFMRKFKMLIVFGDYENGNMTLLDDMKKYFKGQVKHVRPEDYLGEKDANDILVKHSKDAVLKAVENAEPVRANGIVRMRDVKSVEIADMPRVSTGFRKLNEMLGGFFFGHLIVVAGSTGSGKSTLASQFALFAVDAGIKTFFYSGELKNGRLKSWFEYQIAGKMNIKEYNDRFGFKYYRLKDGVSDRIADWCGDLVEMYDNTELEEEEYENQSIQQMISDAIKQGNQMIIIDNLMTAMDEYSGDDFYQAQTKFIKKLSVTAKRNNVIIVLVAHFKKTNGMSANIDSISGSANIVNLADTVITFRKLTEREIKEGKRCSRILEVVKNREIGKTGEIEMWYEEQSRRLSEIEGIFDFDVLGQSFTRVEEDDDIDIDEIFSVEE